MKKLKNSLYITKQGSYLHKDRDTLLIESQKENLKKQIPAHAIDHIFCFGNVLVSPFLMGFCGENGINLSFFTEYGRFLGRLQGPQNGNVLLRRAQYKLSETNRLPIAKSIIAVKINASRQVLQRRIRNHGDLPELNHAIKIMSFSLDQLNQVDTIDGVMGVEGNVAALYFGVFNHLIQENLRTDFVFDGRNRRPPRDPINAMLSFLYSLYGKEISGALQSVGLDPQIGFLHADRPGRDSLAQDILEEFRAWLIDRLVLSLINLKQVKAKDFITEASGAVRMSDEVRKLLLQKLQERKQETIKHPYLEENVQIGLLPYIQSLLLARHLRGDLECYPPFFVR